MKLKPLLVTMCLTIFLSMLSLVLLGKVNPRSLEYQVFISSLIIMYFIPFIHCAITNKKYIAWYWMILILMFHWFAYPIMLLKISEAKRIERDKMKDKQNFSEA